MAIEIVYRGMDPRKEKIKGSCPTCSTRVNMLKEDLREGFGSDLLWICPVCNAANCYYDYGHWPSPFVASMSEQFGR